MAGAASGKSGKPGEGPARKAASTGKLVLWGVVGVLGVGLGGFGAVGLSGNPRSLGTVGELDLPIRSYTNTLRNQIDALSQQFGTRLSFAQAQTLGLDRSVLAEVVAARVMDNEARRLGLSVGDDRVRADVLSFPAFQGLDGQFDRQRYGDALAANGLTEVEFETQLREEAARGLLQGAVLGGIEPDPAYAATLAAFAGERRAVLWVRLDASALPDVAVLPEPSDAEVQAAYDANPAAFTAPEVRQIAYAWLTPDLLQDTVTVDDQAVRDLYDSRISQYRQEERRLVERLVFGTEEEAAAARARLDAGEIDFDALVAERGLDLADIDLGDVTRGDLDAAADSVFATEPGAVAGPVMSSLGPALFRVNAVLAADETPYEEAEPELRAELANQRARRLISDRVLEIEDLLAGGAGVADIAARTGLTEGTIDWSVEVSDGIAAYESFRETAAALTQGDLPQLVELSDGGVAVLSLTGVTPPALRPLDEVRGAAAALWAEQEIASRLAARAAELAAAPDLGAALAEAGLIATVEPTVARSDFLPDLPQDFAARVFALAPGEVATLPAEGGAQILVQLQSVTPADPADPAVIAETERLAAEARQGLAEDIYAAFTQTLQSRTEVRIDTNILTAVNAQFQ